MDQQPSEFEVSGAVSGRHGDFLRNARVVLWWQQIRERKELAAGETSEHGRYRLRYRVPENAPQPLLLVVEVRSEYLDAPLLSPVTPAKPTLEIDLTYEPPDQSEWATLVRAIEPFLSGLTLAGLVEDTTHHDLSFLSSELGKSTEVVMRVALSARLEKAFKIPAPAFYAFIRQQVPASLPSPLLDASQNFTLIDALVQSVASMIFALTAQVQTQTLTAAVALDLIGAQYTNQIPDLVKELQSLQTTDLLNQPYLVGNATLGQLLSVAALPAEKQQTFAQVLASNSQSMRNFWVTLGNGKNGFTAAEASSIERTLSLGAFVKNYVPLVTTLFQGFAAGTYKTLPDLARLSVQDWTDLVNKTGAPPGIDAAGTSTPAQVFASVVYTRVTRAYPTAALSGRIATGKFVAEAQQKPLLQFFQNNPELELLKNNIPVYLATAGEAAFAGIAPADQAAVISNARSFQRVLRVAPDTDVAQTLLGMGLTSATQIAALGQQQFFTKATAAGLTKPEANLAYQVAAQRYANVVATYVNFNNDAIGVWPKAMGNVGDFGPPVQKAVSTDPTLSTLFGSQSYCATDDCTSVLSPAAYLCDLLLWLRNHQQGATTVLDVLDGRRPDIRHLLLNCPNSDTELPYIDLVIELLADKVSPPPSTTLAAPITAVQASITVASAAGFPAPGFAVLIGAEILQVTAVGGAGNTTWNVSRGQQGTTAAAAPAGTAVILTTASNPPWKQTSESATSAQLSAAPAYFNQGALVTLFNAEYPQTLPYSAGLDELRTYLLQWNLPLWQLRQALLPLTGASVAQQAAVAAERLRMNALAETLVTVPNFVAAAVAWNIANPTMALIPVPAFLQAASITYESLLELLEVAWVQGGLGVGQQGISDLCDLSVQTLTLGAPLDAGFLDRAHRFLRLWLATGYKMWELDLLLNAPSVGNGTLDQNALIQLQAFWQLQNSTSLAVDQQLAFFQNIDTNTHRDPDGTTTTPLYSQIYLNPTTTWIAPDPDLVSLPTGGAIGDAVLSDHAKAIQPALGVSASDLATLVALTNNQLTLGNLSLLYRINALAVASKFSITSLLNVAGLLNAVALAPATTLAAAITSAQKTITVASAAPFRPPNFYVTIGTETLLVTAMGGPGNTTWTVVRGQLGTIAAPAAAGVAVTSDFGSPAAAVAALTASPAATNTFLKQAVILQQQSGLTPDAINYLLSPPSSIVGGWATTSQMTPANIAATLTAVQQAVLNLMAASTTLAANIGAGDTTITVAGDAGFPAPNFYVYIGGAEIAQVTAVGGNGNTTWTVVRGQQGTTAAAALKGATVTPTAGDLSGAVIAAVAANAHSTTNAPLTSDVAAVILQSLNVPVINQPLLAVLMDPTLLPATGTITIGGTPAAGDTVQTVLSNGIAAPVVVAYPLVIADVGSVNQTAADFANAINLSAAVTGPTAFLAPCTVSGAVITLNPLAPGGAGSSVSATNTTTPAVSVSPGSTSGATGTITIGGSPVAGDTLQTVLTFGAGTPVTVSYTLTSTDAGSVAQTASDFAHAINLSPAVVGAQAFLAPCAVLGAVITLTPLAPGTIKTANSAVPGVSVSPATAQTIGQPAFANQFLAIQIYDKVGILCRGLRLVKKDIAWLIANSGAGFYGGLNLTQLPVTAAQPAQNLSALLTTLLLIKLVRLWTAAPPASTVQTLYDVIGGVTGATITNAAAAQAALATITGWPLADIESFAAALGLVFPASYQAPTTYDALRTLEAMSAAVGASGPVVSATGTTLTAPITTTVQTSISVTSAIGFPAPNFYINIGAEVLQVTAFSGADNTTWTVMRGQQGTTAATAVVGAVLTPAYGAQIVSWGGVPADEISAESMAASALGILKSQQASQDAWLALAPTLMNPVRENQSNALQAYLIAQRDGAGNLIYSDTNGLFNYFLIDTQMTSCMLTSRVVQAYIAVQIFVERCLMNLEAPQVVVDLTQDDTWNQWEWMSRYRIWEANREVFLFPENWLIESQRPNRTETYQTFEQEVRQGESTADYLETVVLNYIDRLDGLAHLRVTGTCEDPESGTIYVVARALADPPVFYLRTYVRTSPSAAGAWSGWTKIPLDIKAHQAIPALYRGRVCLFWVDIKVSNEPQQTLPAAQQSSTPPPQKVDRYVTLGVNFSIFRNGSWAPAQTSKGKLFDKPLLDPTQANDTRFIEALYTLKVQTPAPTPGYGANLYVDVFRLGNYIVEVDSYNFIFFTVTVDVPVDNKPNQAVHIGRAVFDGRFSDLELSNLPIYEPNAQSQPWGLLAYAQATYGPDAKPLLPLSAPDPDLGGEFGLVPQAGALETIPADPTLGSIQTLPLIFFPVSGLDVGPFLLLATVPMPFRVVGPDTDLAFDPASYFFFEDNRRSYYVESPKFYWTGSAFSPVVPSDPGTVPYEIKYDFHVFYHPFTRLFWNQLAGGGFDLLYDPNLQENPDQIDPSGADVFSFNNTYHPLPTIQWDHDDVTGQDRQFLDFGPSAAFSVYNWELFYHIPLYIAQLLSQNQQFDDAQTWYHYIFNPTLQGTTAVPQRFWIPKPLRNLTSAQILAQQINNLLVAVNQGNPTFVAQVEAWRNNPFNPFVLADMRQGVPYMKSTVMSYLDNLIAWGDNLFSTESREALSEATLLYVIASEILGPTPDAVTPPQHADESFDQLEPKLDAFANAMVEIENVVGGAGGSGSRSGGNMPSAQTFYFKIPPNATLLNYWSTVADRLFKLRNCQNIAGAPLQLALFDAPIDPGLLIAAQAAGVDLSSVLSDMGAPMPNYRFTALYPQALDFVNAVRAYGASLQAALEKNDAGALALLQQTTQQQLLTDGGDILDWQLQVAQSNIAAINESLNLATSKYEFNTTQPLISTWEGTDMIVSGAAIVVNAIAAIVDGVSAATHALPTVQAGAAGMGGTPVANASDGGPNAGHSTSKAADALKAVGAGLDKSAALASKMGQFNRKMDAWVQAGKEANIQVAQANDQLNAANLALQIAQQNQVLHQEQIDNIQKQIDFLNDKFTNNSLYDWMAASLSATYFQSYQLAYQMCKQVERCYRFELGIFNSSFIQFGYWDNLYKGLLSGETLNHDLRRMQASYLQQNARRFEMSRYVSLGVLDPIALQNLIVNGACDFSLPESLFDNDYPGHYNRRLTRVSMTVVYPGPGKFDNVKATLTLTANKVRVKTDTTAGYAEAAGNADPRFVYNYAAVPQKIVMGNAQDDPGLFIQAIASNIADQRYLPFENAGAISSWHLEMPQITNEIDTSTVGDVMVHLYYTALDGGGNLQQVVQQYNAANAPTSGVKVFSAQNDFAAPAASAANPYPLSPWQAFLSKPLVTSTTLAWPITASQTTITVASDSGFPAATPFLVNIGDEILDVTAVGGTGNTSWTVTRGQQGTAAAPATTGAVVLLPAAAPSQVLTLSMSASKFPAWTRGKTISVTSVTVLVISWQPTGAAPPGPFNLAPQAPFPTATINMLPVAGSSEPNVCTSGVIIPTGGTAPLGTWNFELQLQTAANFNSLSKSAIGDVLLLVTYHV